MEIGDTIVLCQISVLVKILSEGSVQAKKLLNSYTIYKNADTILLGAEWTWYSNKHSVGIRNILED